MVCKLTGGGTLGELECSEDFILKMGLELNFEETDSIWIGEERNWRSLENKFSGDL